MTAPETTEALVQRAQEGDRDALGKLFEGLSPRLEAAISARMGEKLRGQVEPADILQETLGWATKAIGRFRWRGEDSFYRWLRGIAEHAILKAASGSKSPPILRLPEAVPGESVTASKAVRRQERFDRLQEALDSLSPDHRTVVLLARIEGLPVKEISARMGRSENAVMLLLSRALRGLRERIGSTTSFHLPDRILEDKGVEDGKPR
jgi:RNA polymerase sigma-70 factor (ECF subfamily)